MAKKFTSVDVSDRPDLLKLAEEVHRTGTPCRLRRNGEDLAVLSPAPAKRRTRKAKAYTESDREAFLESAGGWAGNVDVDTFLEDNYASRDRSSRPPVNL